MNTKEAIDWLEQLKTLVITDSGGNKITISEELLSENITLLKRGEAFEEMWEDLDNYFDDEKRQIAAEWILGKMENIKQKHFPKKKKRG